MISDERAIELEKAAWGRGDFLPSPDNGPYPSDDWQEKGYKTPAEEIEDMANVGRALMECVASVQKSEGPFKNWSPMDCPSEIVTDMHERLGQLVEAAQGVMGILGRVESNASGNPEWDYVGPRVAAFRAVLAAQ